MSAKTADAKVSSLDHAMQVANTPVNGVAGQFHTDNREFAYHVHHPVRARGEHLARRCQQGGAGGHRGGG